MTNYTGKKAFVKDNLIALQQDFCQYNAGGGQTP